MPLFRYFVMMRDPTTQIAKEKKQTRSAGVGSPF
jgi:hypothetical protein